MRVEVVSSTPRAEEVVCRAARNDYMEEFNSDMSLREIMQGIEHSDEDEEWALQYAKDANVPIGDSVEGTPYMTTAKQRALLRRLMKHGHFGPFEHPQATFHVKGISRSCMAQITRHRHASFDIQSMRYVSFDDFDPGDIVVTIPELGDTGIVGRNAEFSERWEDEDDRVIESRREMEYRQAIEKSFQAYNSLLDLGVAPENARMVLPIGTKVNMVFSVNARMLMHIADMRAAGDAQWEIREMTEAVLDKAEQWMPMTFDLYNEHLRNRKNRLAP